MRCVYRVHRGVGPWHQGWWLSWGVRESDPAIIAMLDLSDPRSVVGAWDTEAIPTLFGGLIDGAITLYRASPGVLEMSYRELRNAALYPLRPDGRARPELRLLR